MNIKLCRHLLYVGMFMMLGLSSNLYASHAIGMDLSYECQGGNQYEFVLKLYRDCSGVNVPATVDIQLHSPGCGDIAVTLVQGDSSVSEVSPLCPGTSGQLHL